MTLFLLLFVAMGVAPLSLGLGLMLATRRRIAIPYPALLGSILFCALAFNLVFFWQELWLVIPKALTPGLHPTLFHNDHQWTGNAPIAELLQGSGAVATLVIGLVFAALLTLRPGLGDTIRLFCFWMAFQGLNQSLVQLAVGLILPGNDVGRALAYLHVGPVGHVMLAIVAAAGLAGSGATLARIFPGQTRGCRVDRSMAVGIILLAAILSIILIVPFRIPRNPIETTLIPLVVNLTGAGWTVLGFALAPSETSNAPIRVRLAIPMIGVLALLLIFQLVLRPGINF